MTTSVTDRRFSVKNRLKIAWAALFAIVAHTLVKQKRLVVLKDGNVGYEPYWRHCQRVASRVKEIFASYDWSIDDTTDAICAAWLHDTVEDTWVSHGLIRMLFGDQVGRLVYGLTDIATPEDGNRATRKAMERRFLAWQPIEVKLVKMVDIMDNAEGMKAKAVHESTGFPRLYIKECVAMIDAAALHGWDIEVEALDALKRLSHFLDRLEGDRKPKNTTPPH